MTLYDWIEGHQTAIEAIATVLAWFRHRIAGHARAFARWSRLLAGAITNMPNLMTLIPVLTAIVACGVKLEAIETNPNLSESEKKTEFLAAAPALFPLVDQAGGFPPGAVEKYLTPANIAFAYDAVLFAEHKLANPSA